MKKGIIFFSMLITISMSCKRQSVVDSIQNQLLGKWFLKDRYVNLEFSNDTIYKFFLNNKAIFAENYRIVISNDSIFRYHYNDKYKSEGAKDDTTKYLMYLSGDELLQINYKSGVGINEHLDEFGFFYKQGTNPIQRNPNKMETDDYLLSPHFRGEIRIAYKGGGKEKSYKEQLIKIPPSGLLERDCQENIQNYARQNFRFYYKNGGDDSKKELKKLDLSAKYSAQELETYNEKEVFVIALGYNQANRPEVNTVFGKEIVGNVEFYIVDTFKNLIKYLEK